VRRSAAAIAWTTALVGATIFQAAGTASAGVSPGVGAAHPLADPVPAWHQATAPAVAGGDPSALAVWTEAGRGTGPRVAGSVVRADGSLADPHGVVLGPSAGLAKPAIAWNGQSYLVVTDRTSCVLFCVGQLDGYLVDPSGGVVRSVSIVPPSPGEFAVRHLPSVAAVGDQFLVAWRAADGTIDGRVVGPTGSLSSVLAVSSGAGDHPAAGPVGASFVVAWDAGAVGSRDIEATTVTTAGAVANPAGTALSAAAGDQLAPAIAAVGTTTVVVWEDHRGPTADIYGTRLATDGTAADAGGIPIATGVGDQSDPSIGGDGAAALVAWQSGSDVRGARLSSSGTVLDPRGVAISSAPGDQSAPTVGRLARGAFVAWQDGRAETAPDVFGGRVSEAATSLDGNGVLLSQRGTNSQSVGTTAWVGDHFVSLWTEDLAGDPSAGRPVVGRSDANGLPLDGRGRPVDLPSSVGRVVDAAWNGSNFLVVLVTGSLGATDLKAVHVDAAGQVLDSPFPIVTAANDQLGARVAWNGSSYVVAWYDTRASAGSFQIFAGRLDRTGRPLDGAGVQLSTEEVSDVRPAVALNGSTAFVVWQAFNGNQFEAVGRRLSSTGAALGSPVVLSGTTVGYEPTVAVNGSGWVAAWEDLSSSRIVARLVGSVGTPGGEVIPVSSVSPGSSHVSAASSAWDGRDTLITWRRSRDDTGESGLDILAARITTSGTVRDAAPLAITDADGDRYDSRIAPKSPGSFAVTYSETLPGAPDDGATRTFIRMVRPK
jgi:hypothetical protein